MTKNKITEFFKMTQSFFTSYLPKQRNFGRHTIRAYQKSLELLVVFAAEQKHLDLCDIDFDVIDSTMLSEFLNSLEEKGNSIATRNQRLKGIRAFYTYAAMINPMLTNYRIEINKICLKKSTNSTVDYLSEDAVSALLNAPDTETQKGVRDQFILIFLYDTAARVQELVDVKLKDIHLGKTPTVTLHGKGGKTRIVPLMIKTIQHFEQYCKIFHPEMGEYSSRPLFYTVRNGVEQHINESTIRKLIGQYGEGIKKRFPQISGSIHPHLLRHSRAMHLYQHGMDLMLISQWLGHANLETTLIYAHADTEHKRKAIARATSENDILPINSDRYIVSDDTLLKKLYGLK